MSRWSLLVWGISPTIMYKSVLNKMLKEPLWRYLWHLSALWVSVSLCLSLTILLSSKMICCPNSSCLHYPRFWNPPPRLAETLHWRLGNLCRQKTGAIKKFTWFVFISSPWPRVPCFPLSEITVLATFSGFYRFCLFFRKRLNTVLIPSSYLGMIWCKIFH